MDEITVRLCEQTVTTLEQARKTVETYLGEGRRDELAYLVGIVGAVLEGERDRCARLVKQAGDEADKWCLDSGRLVDPDRLLDAIISGEAPR